MAYAFLCWTSITMRSSLSTFELVPTTYNLKNDGMQPLIPPYGAKSRSFFSLGIHPSIDTSPAKLPRGFSTNMRSFVSRWDRHNDVHEDSPQTLYPPVFCLFCRRDSHRNFAHEMRAKVYGRKKLAQKNHARSLKFIFVCRNLCTWQIMHKVRQSCATYVGLRMQFKTNKSCIVKTTLGYAEPQHITPKHKMDGSYKHAKGKKELHASANTCRRQPPKANTHQAYQAHSSFQVGQIGRE